MPPLSTVDHDSIVYPTATSMQEQSVVGECSTVTTAARTRTMTTKKRKPLSSSQAKQRKSVSFDQSVKVRKTIHILDYTDEELFACWYSNAEFDNIRQNNAVEVKFFFRMKLSSRHGEKKNDDNGDGWKNLYCKRGLESFLSKSIMKRRHRAIVSREAVYDEQEYQWDHHQGGRESYDVECNSSTRTIARVYEKATLKSRALARYVGLKDALEVQKK